MGKYLDKNGTQFLVGQNTSCVYAIYSNIPRT